MKKWLIVLLISVVASISACSLPDNKEKDAGANKGTTPTVQQEEKVNNKMNNEVDEQELTKVFSDLMSLKLPQGLEAQSNEAAIDKLLYTNSNKSVRLEMKHDPEQMVTDAGMDGSRIKMKAILEQDSDGEKLEWLKDETLLVHGKHIAINEVIVPSGKEERYRLIGWAELDGALLEIDFSAPATMKDEWQKVVYEMLESIQM